MAPKIKTSPHVFIVISSTGVDSVHVTIESAQKRASAAKSEGSTNIKLEVHSVVGGRAQIDAEKPDEAAAKAKPEVKASEPLSQVAKLKEQIGDASATPATPPPPPKEAQSENAKSEAKPAESKAKDAQQPDSTTKAKESKPKDSKPKEPKTKEVKAKEPKAKETKPKEPKSETKPKDTKAKEPKSDAKPDGKTADSKEAATPSKAQSKTISADEQRATNAKKGTKAADEDLPANVQALLSSTSSALDGLTIVVTGVPPTIGRKNAEKLVTVHGGKLGKSITGRTDLVVLGNDAGPKKLEQIKDLAVQILDEDGLIRELENGGGSVAAKKNKRSAAAVSDEDGEDGGKAKKVKK